MVERSVQGGRGGRWDDCLEVKGGGGGGGGGGGRIVEYWKVTSVFFSLGF